MQTTLNHIKSRWKLLLVLLCAGFNVALLIHYTKPNATDTGSESMPFRDDLEDNPRYLGRVRIQDTDDEESDETVQGHWKQPKHKFVLQIDAEGDEQGTNVVGGDTDVVNSEDFEPDEKVSEDDIDEKEISGAALNVDEVDQQANESPNNITEADAQNISDLVTPDQTTQSTPAESHFSSRTKAPSAAQFGKFEFLINPSTACHESEENDVYLVIGVCSAAQRVDFRAAIRETWGSVARQRNKYGVRIVFIVGTPEEKYSQYQSAIKNESQEFHDIIQIKQVDHSRNLSFKTLAFLEWVEKFCKDAKFVMKSDDDVFINLRDLFKILSDLAEENRSNVMMGHLIKGARPITDRNDPWFYPAESYNHRTYPDYLSGSAYLFPSTVVSRLLSVARRTPVFWLEDIYITGILARAEDITLIHNPRFLFMRPEKLFNLCRVSREVVVLHGISTEEIHKFWKALNKLNC